MTAATATRADWPVPTSRWALTVLVVLHVPAVLVPVLLASLGQTGFPSPSGAALVAVPAGLALGVLQLRHSLSTARGETLRGGGWTLLAMALAVYSPVPWLGVEWSATTALLVTSAWMILRGWRALVATAIPLATYAVLVVSSLDGAPPGQVVYAATYLIGYCLFVCFALNGAARLVWVLDEEESARAELAALAVGRERLRVSRDLHDLVGQSLSAVSLKAELSMRLLRSDPPAARVEIESLAGVARDAQRGVRAIVRGDLAVSLRAEVDGAAALLAAAGIDAPIELDLPDLDPAVERVLAWTVREGVTNVLRHSTASVCMITGARRNGTVALTLANNLVTDKAAGDGEGAGLVGLASRVRGLSGSITAERTAHGWFRLHVELPEEVE